LVTKDGLSPVEKNAALPVNTNDKELQKVALKDQKGRLKDGPKWETKEKGGKENWVSAVKPVLKKEKGGKVPSLGQKTAMG